LHRNGARGTSWGWIRDNLIFSGGRGAPMAGCLPVQRRCRARQSINAKIAKNAKLKLNNDCGAVSREAYRIFLGALCDLCVDTLPATHTGLTRSFKAIPAFGHLVSRFVSRPDGDDTLVVTAHFDRRIGVYLSDDV
jgi:hypothetical protein